VKLEGGGVLYMNLSDSYRLCLCVSVGYNRGGCLFGK
jgi:hypothetical protein